MVLLSRQEEEGSFARKLKRKSCRSARQDRRAWESWRIQAPLPAKCNSQLQNPRTKSCSFNAPTRDQESRYFLDVASSSFETLWTGRRRCTKDEALGGSAPKLCWSWRHHPSSPFVNSQVLTPPLSSIKASRSILRVFFFRNSPAH